MTRLVLGVLAAALVALVSAGGPSAAVEQARPDAQEENPPAQETPEFVPGEVIVALEPGMSPEFLPAGAGYARKSPVETSRMTVSVPPGTEESFIAALSGRPGVRYAELNTLAQPSYVPNDPEYPLQWGIPMIGTESVWNTTRGEGVTVAVVDTGVAFETRAEFARSPELSQATFVFPYDATTGSAHPNDANGHGTHVTGTIAQDTGDGVGVSGMAPEALIMPVQVCRVYGCPADAMADGIQWAVDHGANVINMSLGGPSISNSEREALENAEERGVVVVAAAGNGGSDFVGDERIDYPAAVSTVISVGAITLDSTRAPYSNYGRPAGQSLHVVAPGGNIRVDVNRDGNPDGVLQNTFAHTCGGASLDFTVFKSCYYHGTSMAAPHVTGTVALLLSMYPSLRPEEVRTILRCSVLDLGPHGHDLEHGAGLVRVDVAVRDTDADEVPDCLEEPTSLLVTIGSAAVPKDTEFSLPIRAYVDGQGISGYNINILYEPALADFVECFPRAGGACTHADGVISLIGSESPPLRGEARLAEIRLRSSGSLAGIGSLFVAAGAEPASPSDPGPVISVQGGQISVIAATSAMQGDTDCNQVVDAVDMVLVLRDAGGGVPGGCVANGDVDCSGLVGVEDVRHVALHLALIPVPVTPGCTPIGLAPEPTATPSAAP